MTGARGTADRFRDLVRHRLLPGLADLGFRHRLPGSLAAAEGEGTVWLVDLEVAPWSSPHSVSFTVAWGVHVPGIEEAVGDPVPETPTLGTCAMTGRLGRHPLDARWYELRSHPRLWAAVAEAAVAKQVLRSVETEVLPALQRLRTPVDVQRQLHADLVTGRGAPRAEELQSIRRIAALSLLLGDRANASRWLDHLERRSAAAMAPDVVSERLAPIRQRLAS